MWLASRKYLRSKKKQIFKFNNCFFTENQFRRVFLKKSTTTFGKKKTPHKIYNIKRPRYLSIRKNSFDQLLKYTLYIQTISYTYDSYQNRYWRLNCTDVGVLFLTPGIHSYPLIKNHFFSNFLPKSLYLGFFNDFIKIGLRLSNIGTNRSGYLASSSGTYCQIIRHNGGFYKLKLPSGVTTWSPIRSNYLGSNIWVRNFTNKPVNGIVLKVRGIAKNPVDHPNGGRSNTKGSFKTPWGKIAKHNK